MRVEVTMRAGDAWRTPTSQTNAAVGRAKAGDRDAVGFLYERYAGSVRRLAQQIVGDPGAAEDVMQDVFLRLLTKLDRYEPREPPFETWLLRVTRNAALDELRRRRSRGAEPLGKHPAERTDGFAIGAPLQTALDSLPTAQREVVVLHLIVGLSAAETACRLRRTEASVNNLYYRARATLRRVLTGLGAAPATARSPRPATPCPMAARGRSARARPKPGGAAFARRPSRAGPPRRSTPPHSRRLSAALASRPNQRVADLTCSGPSRPGLRAAPPARARRRRSST
jgi:RNA polymerase sigma-70 factor (ECF subfamily)